MAATCASHRLELGLGQDEELRRRQPEPVRPELDLRRRLLARHVEHRARRAGEGGRGLEEQRGLADARVAADEDERARHDPAAQHAVELGHARVDPGRVRRRHGRQGDGDDPARRAGGRRGAAAAARSPREGGPLLHDRVELPAVRTAPVPLPGLEPARLAPVHRRGFHGFGLPAPDGGVAVPRPMAARMSARKQEAPLGALQERGEILVDRRVLEQAAEGPLAAPRDAR